MSSLADELAADLDFDSGDETRSNYDEENEQGDDESMDAEEPESGVNEENRSEEALPDDVHDIKQLAKLLYSKSTQTILQQIDYFRSKDSDATEPAEQSDEYKLIIQANSITADIDGEIQTVHKFIRDHYAPKFAELESLVLNPLDYARTVKAIGTEKDITKVDLRPILPSATIMVITVTGTTTEGRELTPTEWKVTEEACDMALELDLARKKIMSYVESRMTIIAPNLSYVVGSSTAARLLTAAGGLLAFCKIPACNVMVLGHNRKANTGFSSAHMERHTGYIYHSELVYSVPQDLRKRLAKKLANKCVLAARCDASKAFPNGEKGKKMREVIDQEIDKWQEPPPTKIIKALPVPDEGPKKRRGGRRVRKMKEAYAMTELRAARNTMAFGEQEEEVVFGDETEGLGMAVRQTGKIRASVADARNKVKAPKQKSYNTSGTTSGLASSLSFTPVQGIELIDPTAAAARAKQANEKYFGDGAFSIIRK
ncbi:U4/U6-U5 snRNP complex subunit prp31 [Apophysomyces sp. BC1034]|nr:U4/U6-U5 snRNP complex subunit prp31 [Apophysomyces sp. BC1015]KAG0179227.1 U4/U6-U5 snRNP complex subunit prp31 [Apophysomyces sp. BC1021]KAG0189635.1 U4/U6-U5 snRNP complex subunit prp31 [Apophysomyces sp. BC1034]